MLFSAIAIVLLPLLALAHPPELEKRQSISVLAADLNTLINDVVKINDTLNTIPPSTPPTGSQIVTLQGELQQFAKDLNKTVTDAQATPVLSAADCARILALLKKLCDAIKSLLQNLLNHYPGLKAAGLLKYIHDYLVALKSRVAALLTALQKICPDATSTKAFAQFKKDCLDIFDPVITKFSQ